MLISVSFISQLTEGQGSFIVLLSTFNHNILYNFNIEPNQIMEYSFTVLLGRFYATNLVLG